MQRINQFTNKNLSSENGDIKDNSHKIMILDKNNFNSGNIMKNNKLPNLNFLNINDNSFLSTNLVNGQNINNPNDGNQNISKLNI